MRRSLDDFIEARQQQTKTITKEKPTFQNVSGRGLDSFWNDRMRYYQEAAELNGDQQQDPQIDENNEQQNPQSNDDIPMDVDMDQAAANMDNENEFVDDGSANNEDVETDGINGTLPEEQQPDNTTDIPEENNEQQPQLIDGHDEEENMNTFGQNGGDHLPNNQYDPQEIAKVMEFVADEAKSLSDYLEAAKTSKVDILQRLYSDIADEERYHMEQLLFAKAEITGEEYKPRDPDIRKEYEELLSMGMDEGSAMATAVDKFNLHVTTITPADDAQLQQANTDMNDAVQEMDTAFLYMDTVTMIIEYCTDDYVLDKLQEINAPKFYQEDVEVTIGNRYSNEMGPLRVILTALATVHKVFMKIARFIHLLIQKNFARIRKTFAYVKQHGIGELFKHGVTLYLWNDTSSTYEIDPVLYYANCALWACQEIVRLTKMRGQYATEIMGYRQLFDLTSVKKQQYTKRVGVSMAYQYLSSIDPIKTKVVVTPKNAQRIENAFFGSNDIDTRYAQNFRGSEVTKLDPNGDNLIPQFENIFNKLDRMFQIITTFTNTVTYFTGELEDLQNDNGSIFFKNRRVYMQCVDYLKGVSKGLSTLSKICSYDIDQMNKLLVDISNV
jgi:rubrerythrin